MPHLHRAIDTCGYNPGAKVIAFRTRNLGVVVEAGKIIINDTDNTKTAHEVLDWLKDMMKSAT
ncbi:MAG: hypothetical protein A2Y90_04610 [Chloroflexi bacterium RBG_13_52_12]|nr:MAG: hypothetical protein A2Y90_04610 [Chloroflexi bacterium RBG_13_52_12]